jgi:hypothetical protein
MSGSRQGSSSTWEQLCLEAHDRIVDLDLSEGGGRVHREGALRRSAAGRSPVDRGKQGTNGSVLVDGSGIPLGCVVAPASSDSMISSVTTPWPTYGGGRPLIDVR